MKSLAELAHDNVIRGIEIFSPGVHNGDTYTEQDVDDIVAAAHDLDFRPALKIGHTKDAPGAPAYGWITNLRKAGGKLVADFESMHDSVIAALRDRRYDRVSSEIYFNLKRGAKTFRRALKAVALLGAEVPAVANLTPLHKMEFAADSFEKLSQAEQQLTVEAKAIIDAMAARIVELSTFVNEKDTETMKTVAALKAEVKTLSDQLATLSAGNDKDKDAKIAQLNTQLAALESDIKAAEQSEADRAAAQTAQAEAKAAKEEAAQLALRVKALEAAERQGKVREFVAKLTVPAFRPQLEAFYSYAIEHGETKVKVFSKDKDGKEVTTERTLCEVAEDLITQINSQAKRLFAVHDDKSHLGERPEGSTDENPDVEIDRLTKAHMAKHNVKGYAEAMEAVMKDPANADIVKAYADSQRRVKTA